MTSPMETKRLRFIILIYIFKQSKTLIDKGPVLWFIS